MRMRWAETTPLMATFVFLSYLLVERSHVHRQRKVNTNDNPREKTLNPRVLSSQNNDKREKIKE